MHKISQGQACIIRAVYVWHCVTCSEKKFLWQHQTHESVTLCVCINQCVRGIIMWLLWKAYSFRQRKRPETEGFCDRLSSASATTAITPIKLETQQLKGETPHCLHFSLWYFNKIAFITNTILGMNLSVQFDHLLNCHFCFFKSANQLLLLYSLHKTFLLTWFRTRI